MAIQIQQFGNPKTTILRRFDLIYPPKKLPIEVKLSLNTWRINQAIKNTSFDWNDEVIVVSSNNTKNSKHPESVWNLVLKSVPCERVID